MEPVMARKMWRTLEPYHGLIYFAPEATEAYERIGVTGRSGYFASRAAAMGAVRAEVVVATFFNFHPSLVRSSMTGLWDTAAPGQLLDARHSAVDAALRRCLGDALATDEVVRAAELARVAAEACTPFGRPLFAGHASLPWPDAPHLVLWHAITLLREFRGDGHIAALVDAGLSGLDALVLHAGSGDVPRPALQTSRQWSDSEWEAAVAHLAARGAVDDAGAFTDDGARLWQHIEERTDALALAPWAALGQDGCDELRGLVRPLSKAIVESGTFGFR